MAENGFIPSPEFERLKSEVKSLRAELSALVIERDELVYVQKKNLEMEYMLTLGGLEYRAYELQCELMRLKRELEMIQACVNRQEPVCPDEINRILDEIFAEYRERLEQQVDRMNEALERSRGKVLCEQDAAELKRLYRSVVKALHPDLNPDVSEAKLDLFRRAVEAYENGDLAAMRVIAEMVTQADLPEPGEGGMQALIEERDRLAGIVAELKSSIARIKSEYPFTMRELLSDEAAVAAKKKELEELIARLAQACGRYSAKIKELLEGRK